mmetsp:Transcript_103704/g.260078  ORF Transcript_103704/g.260078 Transcript_103704/m.260078 type:complete len:237 (-) Transcript_103704:1086-1796(-)
MRVDRLAWLVPGHVSDRMAAVPHRVRWWNSVIGVTNSFRDLPEAVHLMGPRLQCGSCGSGSSRCWGILDGSSRCSCRLPVGTPGRSGTARSARAFCWALPPRRLHRPDLWHPSDGRRRLLLPRRLLLHRLVPRDLGPALVEVRTRGPVGAGGLQHGIGHILDVPVQCLELVVGTLDEVAQFLQHPPEVVEHTIDVEAPGFALEAHATIAELVDVDLAGIVQIEELEEGARVLEADI